MQSICVRCVSLLALQTLVETVSCGGNLLMNVGPTHDGRITPIFEERLRQVGQWLNVNGEGIYNTTAWKVQNDSSTPGVWFVSNLNTVYIINKETSHVMIEKKRAVECTAELC